MQLNTETIHHLWICSLLETPYLAFTIKLRIPFSSSFIFLYCHSTTEWCLKFAFNYMKNHYYELVMRET